MIDPYLVLKWVHVLSSTILFGTGIGTAFQMVWALRTNRLQTIYSVASGVVVADWIFTVPAGLVQPVTGMILAHLAGLSLLEPFLMMTYALYILAFLCWLPVAIIQIRIRDLAKNALDKGAPLPDEVGRLFRIWFLLGWPAFLALVGIFWLMIAKPALWG